MKTQLKYLVSTIALLFCVSAICSAADYKADVVSTVGKRIMQSKIFVKGNNHRSEMSMGTMKHISILRADKNMTWILYPSQKTYMENKINKDRTGRESMTIADFQKQGTVKKLGKETVNGQLCDKMKIIPKDKKRKSQTVWYSPKLKTAIKMQSDDLNGFKMELKNIKIGTQPQSLFEIPKGYKLVKRPMVGPGMAGMKMPPGMKMPNGMHRPGMNGKPPVKTK